MLVLGIDPGLATTGFAVVREAEGKALLKAYGCIRTPADMAEPDRLLSLYRGVQELISSHAVDCLAIEKLFFNTNVTTALSVGQARGVILLAAAEQGIVIAEYTPLQVKQAVAGYGRAEKGQVQRMVQSLLGLKEVLRPDDAADAAAICLCHLQSYRFSGAVERGKKGV